MKDKDIKVLEAILRLPEKELTTAMSKVLRKRYKNVLEAENYIVAIGDLPYALVAHLDTVWHDEPEKEIYYDQKQKVMWSPDGLGADDRAGIYAIWRIVVQHGFTPTVILLRGEEKGCIGAQELVDDYGKCPFEANCLIELDRAHKNDCVFYYCQNRFFEDFIKDFDFQFALGTYTDISALMEPWNICGVNLSIGYMYEHSASELLHLDWMEETIEKVEIILQTKSKKFVFRGE